jgi:uncharacterized protein (TIGR00369 family)
MSEGDNGLMLPWLRSGAYVQNTPHAKMLGLELISADTARGAIRLPWREDLEGERDTGIISGGAVTALLDHTCGLAVLAAMKKPGFIATLDLRIDYQRPAEPGKAVTADAHCYKMTRQIAFVRASAWDADPKHPVATAQGTFALTSFNGAKS